MAMQHMLYIHMSVIWTEKERSQSIFQRHTSLCSNELATWAFKVSQLGYAKDLRLFASHQNLDLKQVINGGFKIHKGAPE